MILEESLRNLHVAIRGGGSLISHRPIFSKDSKSLYIISSDTVQIYNTETGDCTVEIHTPSSTPIANILISPSSSPPGESLLILTESGELLHTSLETYEFTCVENVNLSIPKDWTRIQRWINLVEHRAGSLLLVGHPENAEEVMLYQATRDSDSKKGKYHLDKICWRILPTTHSVAVGCNGELVAAVQADSVFMANMTSKVSKWHKSGTRNFTCVAAHPHEWIVATGDDSGRILLWRNFLEEKSPAKAVFHWHTLSVADLCFTTDGTKLLSGGSESCLVRWDTMDASDKKILPRMGLPIRHVNVSYGNALAAVSHADNCVKLVDGANNIVRTIQNITQCYIPEDTEEHMSSTVLGGSSVFEAGLHVDPLTKSLVMNGKPGHLQCYSLREDKHLYNLDITQQNYVTAERRRAIPNAGVSLVAFSLQGRWLATVEALNDNFKCFELRLKFWKFDQTKQLFLLNTSVNWPHEKGVVSLKIQPINDQDPSLLAATSGADKTFKTWGVVHDESIHGKSDWWNCENIGSYRDEATGPLTFSHDGSVLAVPFGRTLTLWKTETHELSGTLCHSKLKDDIKLVEFSAHPTSHLVICCSKKDLIVWDVITLSLVWAVPFETESLAVDRLSNLVAVFSTTQRHLYFFKAENPEPLAIHKNVSRSKIVSSVFVPSITRNEVQGLKSMLVFINSSQELCAMMSKKSRNSRKASKKLKIRKGTSTMTPFAKLIAEKTVSSVGSSTQLLQGTVVGIPGSQVIREIMDASPHTMPSVSFFCNQLLSAISVQVKESEKMDTLVASLHKSQKSILQMSSEDESDDSDSDSDTVHNPWHFHGRTKKSKNLNKSASSPATEEVLGKFEVDLDAVANDDTSWIRAICE